MIYDGGYGTHTHVATQWIIGQARLRGTDVHASDIRCACSLVLAGLAAEGETVVHNAHQFFRGYDQPLEKLKKVGADIYYVNY